VANDDAVYTFRPYRASDIPFIHNSWGNTYYVGAEYSGLISPKDFHKYHREIRENFFRRPTTTVILCVSNETPDLILGWIAVEKMEESKGLILHYLDVKQGFKKEKIATELIKRALPERPIYYTHLTEMAARIIRKQRRKNQLMDFHYRPHLV